MGVRGYKGNHHITAKGPTKPGNRGGRPTRKVWRPAVPSWEKEFCLKASAGMYPSWDKFAEAKKYVHLYGGEVMRWDDAAARDAFHRSKALYYATKFSVGSVVLETLTPPVDDGLYAEEAGGDYEEIDDPELLEGLDSVSVTNGGEEEETAAAAKGSRDKNGAVLGEEIKATGWDDIEAEEYNNRDNPRNLTGLIVGGHGPYFC